MKIYLVRHGESEANVAGIINDDPSRPVHLTVQGRRQAAMAAGSLRGVTFTAAFVSQFPRARETAEILLESLRLSLSLIVDARLDERHSGLDGQPVEAFNGLVRPDPVHIKPAHGEFFLEQMARMRSFLDDLVDSCPDAVVLAVSHENPIMAATALAGRDPEEAARSGLGNGECVVLGWES